MSTPTTVESVRASKRTVPAPALGWALIGAEEEELVLEVLRRKVRSATTARIPNRQLFRLG